MAGKHTNPYTNTKGSHAAVPKHGGPVTGNGHGSPRHGLVKGVIFRLANGKPAVTPKPKKGK